MEADNIIQLVGIALTALVAWWTLKTTFANERRKRQEEEAEVFGPDRGRVFRQSDFFHRMRSAVLVKSLS